MGTSFLSPKNNAYSTLASSINDVVETITLTTGEGARFPASNFNITIGDEIIHVVSRTDDTLTCTGGRGYESTVAAAHLAGVTVNEYITEQTISDLNTAVNVAENLIAYMSRKNAVINGCGIVNQKPSTYTLVKDAYSFDVSQDKGVDRFEGMATGTLVSAGTFANTAAANCGISGYAIKFAGVTLTGTGIIYLRHRIEAKDSIRFKNQTVSFSCKVYQDTGGAINYTVYIRKANAADNFSAVTNISNSGAISVPNATATVLPYLAIAMGDCSNGIEIEVKVECGAVTIKNFEFTELQLEPGSVSTPFEFRPYSHEKGLCDRFYCKFISLVQYAPFAVGWTETATLSRILLTFSPMRATPVVVFSGATDFTINTKDGVYTSSAVNSDYISPSAARLSIITGALTAGLACALLDVTAGGTAWISLAAEL